MVHRLSGHRIGRRAPELEWKHRTPTRGNSGCRRQPGATLCRTHRRLRVFSSIGPLEIILVIVVLLVIFGPKRLPSLGKSLGTGMREFKESVTGEDKHREETDATGRPAL